MNRYQKIVTAAAFACIASVAHAQSAKGPDGLALHLASAAPDLTTVEYLGATHAGKRIVAVGENGIVALSDDGNTWRQAKRVPAQSTLTSVTFSDAQHGWAVGHWGVIIRTDDGGENWSLQRSDLSVDQPLFSVHFENASEGIAVGLWSLLLRTTDGGKTWTQSKLVTNSKEGGDRNLFQVFASPNGELYISAEKGGILSSSDGGGTWKLLTTGYNGSFWTGAVLADGTLLVGGLRGSLLRSTDNGVTWTQAKTEASSSITDIIQLPNHEVVATALDGVTLHSVDNGENFMRVQGPDRANYTAVVAASNGQPIYFTAHGIAKAD